MQNRILVAFGIILFGLVAFNTWNMRQLQTQLDGWEARFGTNLEGVASVNGTESIRVAARMGKSSAAASSVTTQGLAGAGKNSVGLDKIDGIDLENPEVRDKIAEIMEVEGEQRKEAKRKEQTEMYLESMVREIDAFAQEYNLDAQMKANVVREVEANSRAFSAVRKDVRDGKISWFDAREEYRIIKEDGAANLTDLLGEEQYEELKGRLWGSWGGRK